MRKFQGQNWQFDRYFVTFWRLWTTHRFTKSGWGCKSQCEYWVKCVDNYHIFCNFTRETFALTKDGRSLHRFMCDSRKRRTEYESNLLTINFDINIISFRIFFFSFPSCVTDRKDHWKEWIIMEKSFLSSSFSSVLFEWQMIYRWRCKQRW